MKEDPERYMDYLARCARLREAKAKRKADPWTAAFFGRAAA